MRTCYSRYFFLLCFLLLVGPTLPHARAQAYEGLVADSTELRVLRQLYYHTQGGQWTDHRRWLQGTTLEQAGTWFGVSVNQGDVVSLSLPGNNLRGDLPGSVTLLRALGTLNLGNNHLGGPLPTTWQRLASLGGLWLDHNQFEGPFPAELWQIPYLHYLNLSDNRLSGTVPDEAGQQQQLYRIELQANRFSGPLPTSLRSMAGLGHLDLSVNQFSGSLPEAWGDLTNLGYLFLGQNQLKGQLPEAWGGMEQLHQLFLDNNQLQGAVPTSLTQLPTLYLLALRNNAFTLLPSWKDKPAPVVLASQNYLDFGSIEPNYTEAGTSRIPGFQFAPQKEKDPEIVTCVVGAYKTLHREMAGSHNLNHYQWERRVGQSWVDMEGYTGPDLAFAAITADMAGAYRQRVTNDHVRTAWGAPFALYTQPFFVDVSPYTPLAHNAPSSAASRELVSAIPASPPGLGPVNYVRTYTARAAFTNPNDLTSAPVEQVQIKTEYLDGLGRPVQTVLRQESPNKRDIVQPVAYDELGRQPRAYLPYTVANDTGEKDGYRQNALREQYAFYRGEVTTTTPPDHVVPGADVVRATAHLPKTGVPYAKKHFEASPLNRVTEQGAPGEVWALGAQADHAVVFQERPNRVRDGVLRWAPGYDSNHEDLLPQAPYAAGELWMALTEDEANHLSRTFTDLQGQVVLKQVAEQVGTDTTWLSTYYVYDDFSRLRAVLPPLAVQRILANRNQVTGAGVERLLFRYRYDAQGRLIEKLVPDTDGYAYLVYDELDRPILTQDVAQRTRGEWVATKYDALGRVILTALVYKPGVSVATLQGEANAATQVWEKPWATPVMGRAYYTNDSYPQLGSGDQLLSIMYYDGYDFDQNGTDDVSYTAATVQQLGGAVPEADTRVQGRATRTQVRVLGAADADAHAWLTMTSFYDEKSRPIQVRSTTARGGEDVVSSRYDFAGKVLGSYTVHSDPRHEDIQVQETPEYDHAGRLKASTQSLNGELPVTLATHTYNELGQLEQKVLGQQLQTVDYRYNIRGWLTQINDPSQPQTDDLWSLSLHYGDGFAEPQYNGNIAGQIWRNKSDNMARAYGYRYDKLNRLLQGDFVAKGPADGIWNLESDNYRFWGASYDANGNLLSLRRNGLLWEATRTTVRQYGLTDYLNYRYRPFSDAAPASNRLQQVNDAAEVAPSAAAGQPARPDFQDGTTTGSTQPDYTYDVAGSLISDRNKGITRIQYNHLHLPEQIEWQNGNKLQYVYTAAGQKVAKLVTEANKPAVRTDYLGAWQYEKDSLRWLNHSEGRLLALYSYDAANARQVKYQYEYTLKDHLGNLRVAFHEGETTTAFASMEQSQQEREEKLFDATSLASTRTFVDPQFANTGSYAAKLNAGGSAPKPIGPLKQLTVSQDDVIDLKAFGMFNAPARSPNWGFSLASFVAGLVQQPSIVSGPDGRGPVRILPLLNIGVALLPAVQSLNSQVPTAYARILVFDKDSTLIVEQCQLIPLSVTAKDNYQELLGSVKVQQAGYVQIYVANESNTDVYFDDIQITHKQGLHVQENNYDPFGLDLIGLNKLAVPENRYTFNGQEKQSEFGLAWAGYKFRQYDSQIARFVCVDPLTEEFPYMTTYQFASNSPIWLRELEGLEGVKFTDQNGIVTVEKNVIVLLNNPKPIPEGADEKTVRRIERQNIRINESNAAKIDEVKSELTLFYNGSQDEKGKSVNFKFNVMGLPKPNVEELTFEQKTGLYNILGTANGLLGSSTFMDGKKDLVSKAAVITGDGANTKYGDTKSNTVIRKNSESPEGTVAHEILHTLGVSDNGYVSGGLLASPPQKITPAEVTKAVNASYEKK